MQNAAEMSWAEIKQLFQETDRRFQETDRRFQETDRRFQESEHRFKETERLLKERSEETDRKFQETRELIDRLFKESALETIKLKRQLGKLGNRLGEFVEEMVKPALVNLFQSRGFRVHRAMQNMVSRDDDGRFLAQVDLLVIDSDTAIAVECKSTLTTEDVNEHLDRLGQFKRHWPEYGSYKLLGAVAAMVVPDDVAAYAYRQGLYVLAPSGETMTLLNSPDFSPREW